MLKKGTDRGMRRWRAVGVLAIGVAIGTMVVATPAGAHFRSSIDHIWSHIKPKADARYVNETAIKTIQGDYAGGAAGAAGAGNSAWEGISWGFDFGTAPSEHYIPEGGTPPAECPGSALNPAAAPGHLCIYETSGANSTVIPFTGTNGGTNQASRWGAALWIISDGAGDFWSYGTWAVTSGAGVTAARPEAPARRAGD
jgi:hypothetical protein